MRKIQILQNPANTLHWLLLTGILAAVPHTKSAAADILPPAVSTGFENADPDPILGDKSSTIVTSDPAEVIAGSRSLKGDSQASSTEWNEFFHSRAGLFQADQAYAISFDYKVLTKGANTGFYSLMRRASAGNSSVAWTDLTEATGKAGHAEMAFATRQAGDYYLIIGIRNKGSIVIDNLVIKTDPARRPATALTPAPTRTWKSPGGKTYYADSQNGSDTNDGLSATSPWRTLDKINSGEFGPGDRILLRSGSRWTGFLAPGGSGADRKPIIVDKYGRGPKPQIDAQGKWLSTVSLHNIQEIEVRNLDVANRSLDRQPKLTGVEIGLQDFGEGRHIVLDSLDIHDVFGSNVKDDGGGAGINCWCGGDKTRSRFDGLTIENCTLARTDRNGITMGGNWSRDKWYPSLHVIIRGNSLQDIGGDGIVPLACDGALVEHNVMHGGRMRCDDYAAGIWPWSCDNTLVQYNEVSGMHGTKDGEGYDCDYNCQGTIFQYNYSHDNDGGFMLICNDGGQHLPWNIGNIGSIIRYNVSVNDALHTFAISGPCKDTQIYNNTFYIGKTLDMKIVDAGNWGGSFADNTRFANNIFYVDGKAGFNFGGMTKTMFENNAFYGGISDRPADAHALLTDPKLAKPGTNGNGRDAAESYRLQPGSPCIGAGQVISEELTTDFWGKRISKTKRSIGADQSK